MPAGLSPPVKIERGVIQGDVISPVIFNLFLEPLLRWLACDGCGYTPSCLKEALAALGYADDLALLNNTAAEAQRQLHKVERYAQWAGMDLNVKKCAHTALFHPTTNKRQSKKSAYTAHAQRELQLDTAAAVTHARGHLARHPATIPAP